MLDQPAALLPVASAPIRERLHEEVRALRWATRDLPGEGILAVTKAILQSGVAMSRLSGRAPGLAISSTCWWITGLLDELGVHLETCTTNPRAAALLGARSTIRCAGCVTWKSIVGTNVAADALSTRIARVIGRRPDRGRRGTMARAPRSFQERRMLCAEILDLVMESTAQPASIVRCTERLRAVGSDHTPVMMELRIRACHVTASRARTTSHPPFRAISGSPIRPCTTTTASPIRRDLRPREGQGRGPPACRRTSSSSMAQRAHSARLDLGIIMQCGITNVACAVSTGWRSRQDPILV